MIKYKRFHGTGFDIGMLMAQEGLSKANAYRVVLMTELIQMIGKRTCEFTGQHKWVDTSHAGPESGNMEMHCTRCGFHFRHILY